MAITAPKKFAEQKIAAWREALLDGSRTNQLLYFKGAGNERGAVAVRLFGDSAQLYERLPGNQKSLNVVTPSMLGMTTSQSLISSTENEDQQKRYEQALHRLKRLRERARDAVSNRGVNILYAAFGVVEWQETALSDEIIRSPLILVPVELGSKGVLSDEYALSRLSEGRVIMNPTLREKLKSDFGIELPTITEDGKLDDAEKLSLSAILESITTTLSQNRYSTAWQVVDEAYLGLFTFQRQALYEDLVNNEAMLQAHPIIRVLCGEGNAPLPYAPVIAAEQIDELVAPEEMWQILDADASQQEAILAARNGQSFVLQGPPGTGKSQTIANMIAECMAVGKSILFVSEKMAAIDVVQNRLMDAGLGAFCLNLHHRGTGKGEKDRTYEELKKALVTATDASFAVRQWEENIAHVTQTRQVLNAYVRDLHLPRSPLQRSAFEVYGRLSVLHDIPDIHCSLAGVAEMTPRGLAAVTQALETLHGYTDLLATKNDHVWSAVLVREYGATTQSSIRAIYGSLINVLTERAQTIAPLGLALEGTQVEPTNAASRRLAALGALALTTPFPLAQWLVRDNLDGFITFAKTAGEHARRRMGAREQFTKQYVADALAHDWASYQRVLAAAAQSPATTANSGVAAYFVNVPSWLARFGAFHEVLPKLAETGRALAELCGLPAPATIGEYEGLVTLTGFLLETPQPPEPWFTRSVGKAAYKEALQTAKRYAQCATNRQTLMRDYDETFFDLDLVGLNERLDGPYASILRIVRPGWYADRVVLLHARRSLDGHIDYATLARDVALANETSQLEKQLAEEAEERRERLGAAFDEANTNWELLAAQYKWVEEVNEVLATWEWEWTPQLRRLAAKSKRHWADFTAQQANVARLWAEWEQHAQFIATSWNVAELTGKNTLNDVALLELLTALAEIEQMVGPCWQIMTALASHLPLGVVQSWEGLNEAINQALVVKSEDAWFAEQHEQLAQSFGAYYLVEATDWSHIGEQLVWCQSALDHFLPSAPPDVFINLVTAVDAAPKRKLVSQWLAQLAQEEALLLVHWRESDGILPRESFGAPATFETIPSSHFVDLAKQKLAALDLLERWIAFLNCREQCESLDLGEYVNALTRLLLANHLPSGERAEHLAWLIYEKRFYQIWLETFIGNDPLLQRFHGSEHEATINRFQQADRAYLRLARQRLVHAQMRRRQQIQAKLAAPFPDELSQSLLDLQRQVNLKRRKPLRKLIDLCGLGMRELMPCWMMSPLSVSEYIDPKQMQFDIVIFDEASQICAEDAISSILRGRQVIVVGDQKQLPPTNVFRKMMTLEEPEEDEVAEDAQRLESILAECAAALPHSRMLRFHYRSRHESLIAFSNAHFYNGELMTFPSPQTEHAEGLRFVHVEDGIYDRGGSRTNQREAAHVADLVFEHIQQSPELSLGVVAFSAAQQIAIENCIYGRLKDMPELEAWFQEDKPDAFFIRNLESVQGDERDVIILSVGYGRDAAGKMTQNFGPLNSGGGERRLNVAITRARRQMIVVSSITSADVTGTSVGAQALHHYLAFAEHGKSALATATAQVNEDRFDSLFEEEVCRALRAKGLPVDTQIGCAQYRIDMGIRDAHDANHYALGIECDGASYHSAKTARDRDRLRQQQLENLGWRIHRIWSRDWFMNPAREIEKIMQVLNG